MSPDPMHLALPLRVTGIGRLAALAQDSETEIAQSTALLLSTREGERRSVPDYGTPDPVFGGVDADELTDAVAVWEERADPMFVEQLTDALVEQVARVYPSEQPDVEEPE